MDPEIVCKSSHSSRPKSQNLQANSPFDYMEEDASQMQIAMLVSAHKESIFYKIVSKLNYYQNNAFFKEVVTLFEDTDFVLSYHMAVYLLIMIRCQNKRTKLKTNGL